MALPFELRHDHKSYTEKNWKSKGLICSEEDFEAIYEIYITARNCELCKKKFKPSRDRCMDHDHNTGKFRNICCQTCNKKKIDRKIPSNNTSGYKCITKHINPRCTQGFTWRFIVRLNDKTKELKSSVDLEKVIQFRDKWFKEHPDYYT